MTKYTLIAKSGTVMVFTVKQCAELYRTIYGGVIVTKSVFEEMETQDV